jgi:hypothetical protein
LFYNHCYPFLWFFLIVFPSKVFSQPAVYAV